MDLIVWLVFWNRLFPGWEKCRRATWIREGVNGSSYTLPSLDSALLCSFTRVQLKDNLLLNLCIPRKYNKAQLPPNDLFDGQDRILHSSRRPDTNGRAGRRETMWTWVFGSVMLNMHVYSQREQTVFLGMLPTLKTNWYCSLALKT